MGMYTEIYLKVSLKHDTPEEVINILKHMVDDEDYTYIEVDAKLPKHPLFNTHRWDFMLCCSSYYHIPFSTMELRYDEISKSYYLTGRADLKNYDGEIDKFFDWIRPYCEYPDEFIGYSLYEEDKKPKLYYS